MALPVLGCSDESFVCCTSLFDIGAQLRDLAVAGVNDPACFIDPCGDPKVSGIVSIGRRYAYVPDLVVVSMLSLGPSVKSNDTRGNTAGAAMFRSMWQITLVESGWQVFEADLDDEIQMADPEVIEALAMVSYSHAEQMYRRVGNAVLKRQVSDCGEGCWVHLGDITPLEPDLTAGWQFQVGVSVDMTKTCNPPEDGML